MDDSKARNFEMYLQKENLHCEILQRDRDTKFIEAFDQVFTLSGREIKITPVKSPNLQAFVERVIQTIKHEVLNAFCIASDEHLPKFQSASALASGRWRANLIFGMRF